MVEKRVREPFHTQFFLLEFLLLRMAWHSICGEVMVTDPSFLFFFPFCIILILFLFLSFLFCFFFFHSDSLRFFRKEGRQKENNWRIIYFSGISLFGFCRSFITFLFRSRNGK